MLRRENLVGCKNWLGGGIGWMGELVGCENWLKVKIGWVSEIVNKWDTGNNWYPLWSNIFPGSK